MEEDVQLKTKETLSAEAKIWLLNARYCKQKLVFFTKRDFELECLDEINRILICSLGRCQF